MRSKQQRNALLIKAKILDTNGHYVEKFFSAETIQKDIEYRQALVEKDVQLAQFIGKTK